MPKPKLTFGEKPTIEKEEKPRAKTRGEQVASVSGLISGIPDSLAKAILALVDVTARCERVKATTGILSAGEAHIIGFVDLEVSTIIETLTEMQRDTHAMHIAGIGVEREGVGLL